MKTPNIFVICNLAMFSKRFCWIFPSVFLIFFCFPSLFTDNWWIYLICGIISYPFALFVTYSELLALARKQEYKDAIESYMADKQKTKNPIEI
jgi:hypothetical protein